MAAKDVFFGDDARSRMAQGNLGIVLLLENDVG